MKLTTKRNRWYFWRELFSYMLPMILIVWTVDVFYHFVQCPLHPEWSAPCSVNWIISIIYWIPLLLVIILAIISTSKLKKVKKQIENEFLETAHSKENKPENKKWQMKEWTEEDEKFEIAKEKKITTKSNNDSTKNKEKTTKK